MFKPSSFILLFRNNRTRQLYVDFSLTLDYSGGLVIFNSQKRDEIENVGTSSFSFIIQFIKSSSKIYGNILRVYYYIQSEPQNLITLNGW